MTVIDALAQPRPRHAAFEDGRGQIKMGIKVLDPKDWIEPDEFYADHLLQKERLLDTRHGDVFAALPGSEPAQAEVLARLADHMAEHWPDLVAVDDDRISVKPADRSYPWRRDGTGTGPLAPLDLAGRLVQEDLCVMEPSEEGYRLIAASLCFPSRWRLADKVGKPMAAIHGPVPSYADKLRRPVDRLFARLEAGKPVWRINWSVVDLPDLFQPSGHGRADRNTELTPENAGEHLWLRYERQTLSRMPDTGVILFTIKIHSDPLSVLADQPVLADALLREIEALPDDMRLYKSFPRYGAVAEAWLRQVLEAAGSDRTGG